MNRAGQRIGVYAFSSSVDRAETGWRLVSAVMGIKLSRLQTNLEIFSFSYVGWWILNPQN